MQNNTQTPSPEEKPIYKYRIKEYLETIAIGEYADKLTELSEKLDTAIRTLYSWAAIPVDSEKEIPEGKLELLAKYFNLENAAELRNYEPTFKN